MGSSATKQAPGAYEIALGENADIAYKNYLDNYRPLESGFVEEAGRDFSKTLAGRANADASQAYNKTQSAPLGSGSSGGYGSGNSLMKFTAGQVARSDAVGTTIGNATVTAQDVKDKAQLGTLKVGMGGKTLASEGLRTAASAQNRDMLSKAQADSSISDTNMAFATDLGAGLYKKYYPTDTTKLQKHIDEMNDLINKLGTMS